MTTNNIVTVKQHNYTTNETEVLATVSTHALARCLNTEQLAELLDDWVNIHTGFQNGLKMGRTFQGTHRTLQGQLVNLALGILVGLGETDPRRTDARNEYAIQAANKVKAMVESGELPSQPFI